MHLTNFLDDPILLNFSATWLSISNSKVRSMHGYGTVVITALVARAPLITALVVHSINNRQKVYKLLSFQLSFYFEFESM